MLGPSDDARDLVEANAQAFDRDGYVIFERVLSPDAVTALRSALEPYLSGPLTGRNNFEGVKTRRVYSLIAKNRIFADLVTHPVALGFVEHELGPSCLLSACLAISIEPGESVQPWHYDDQTITIPRPRPAYGVSAFWALDDTTETNGATEILPGSHLWPEQELPGALRAVDFVDREPYSAEEDPGSHPEAKKVLMPAGSLMVAKGTLWHRGGANRSSSPRLIITPQYGAGWARQLENMVLAVPPELAKDLPPRAQELLGYSIQPPFMGYVNGMHPKRLLEKGEV